MTGVALQSPEGYVHKVAIPKSGTAGRVSPGFVASRMTPHLKRVERLIRVELAGLGLRANLDSSSPCERSIMSDFRLARRAGHQHG